MNPGTEAAGFVAGIGTRAALTRALAENQELSAALLEMSGRLETAIRAARVDRLLNAILLRHLTETDRVEVSVESIDRLQEEIASPRGLQVRLAKDERRGVWMIDLAPVDPSAKLALVKDGP